MQRVDKRLGWWWHAIAKKKKMRKFQITDLTHILCATLLFRLNAPWIEKLPLRFILNGIIFSLMFLLKSSVEKYST